MANLLANAVAISKEKGKTRTCEHILLACEVREDGADLISYGVSPHAAGRTIMALDESPNGESSSVAISREHADGLQSLLRKVTGGQGARVGVTIYDEPTSVYVKDEMGNQVPQMVNLLITSGADVLASLLDSDPAHESDKFFDWVDEMLRQGPVAPGNPVMFATETLTKLKDIRTDGTTVDIMQTQHDRIMTIAMGSNFRGLLSNVGREIYAEGGPWGDGPGRPSHLLA